MKSIYEELGGTYTRGEDGCLYPDLELPKEDAPRYGKYGMLRKDFLREHRQQLLLELALQGKLVAHLNEIDETVRSVLEHTIREMARSEGINETLKARDPMAWTGAMNSIKSAAEEFILSEYIYR